MSLSTLSRPVLWWTICLTAGAVLGLLLWLKPATPPKMLTETAHHTTATRPSSSFVSSESATIAASQLPAHVKVTAALPTLAPSLQGTDIDCPLHTDPQGQLLLNSGIRTCFDYFLSSIGEKTEAQLIADIRQYLTATLPTTAATYGQTLLTQYITYKHAETRFAGQATQSGNDASKLQTLLDAVIQLRRQYFSAAEANALFGQDETFTQYTIQQMRIHANPNLTNAQKATQLAALLDALPPQLAEGIRTSSQYANLQQLTQSMKNQHASPAAIQDMRTRLVGAEAAERLGQLDNQRAQWHSRIDAYLRARQHIINQLPTGSEQDQAITILRNQTFNEPAEQTRAQAYEAMYDHHDTMPD